MGLLKVGRPLTWEESKTHLEYVRRHGVLQFIEVYERVRDTANDDLFWGDEVEYAVLQLQGQGQERTISVALMGSEVMQGLRQREDDLHDPSSNGCTWHQEYGSWMLEGTPAKPYAGFVTDLLEVEKNMRLRRARILAFLPNDHIAPTTSNFPIFGVGSFTIPASEPEGPIALSAYVSDASINPHPRFGALTRNIRSRRGSNVDIRVPLFRDLATPEFVAVGFSDKPPPSAISVPPNPVSPPLAPAPAQAAGSPASFSPLSVLDFSSSRGYMAGWPAGWPEVHMDAMAFGMGCCCLQVTFQSRDVVESRWLYDQLAGLTPILLALTGATPIAKGRLLDSDARWAIIAQSVDDRTPAERGVEGASNTPDAQMAGGGVRRIHKSRYDSISCYLSEDTPDILNDIACEVDEELKELLLAHGMDQALSRHVAHIFVRDPLVIFDGNVEQVSDTEATDHWENLQSTNWNTMRWKPPPPSDPSRPDTPHIGWRTEFRSMEVQLSDFENAAWTVFIVLVTRVLLVFDLDLRIPLSFVDANMHRAHKRSAVTEQKFFFRNCFNPIGNSPCKSEVEEMTMEEIMAGKGDYFPGLIPLIHAYLEHINCDSSSYKRIDMYLNLIMDRAVGKTQTNAAWIRDFVQRHPDYKQDSVVSPIIAHDLMKACNDIGKGTFQPKELFGTLAGHLDEITSAQAYGSPLASEKVSANCRSELIRRITSRVQATSGRRRSNSAHVAAEERKSKYLNEMAGAAEAGLRDF